MSEKPYTPAELRKFDRMTMKMSSRNQVERINARFDVEAFVKEHGKEKCETMFAALQARDKSRVR